MINTVLTIKVPKLNLSKSEASAPVVSSSAGCSQRFCIMGIMMMRMRMIVMIISVMITKVTMVTMGIMIHCYWECYDLIVFKTVMIILSVVTSVMMAMLLMTMMMMVMNGEGEGGGADEREGEDHRS